MDADLVLGDDLSGESKEHNSNPKEISDVKLWLKFQEGDQEAFEEIYAENIDRLYSYGLKLVSDKDLVKDVIQDLFEEIWYRKEKLGKVKSIKSYLYKALRWKLIRKATKQRKLLSLVDKDLKNIEQKKISSKENKFEEAEYADEMQRKLRIALSNLNKKQQEIIHLRFYDGLTIKEIAKITGINKKTVYYNLSQALKLLKKSRKDLFLLLIYRPFYRTSCYPK